MTAKQADSLKVLVHPLVIMQISEHYSRTRVQRGSAERVYGVLLGQQKSGRVVELINSFALLSYADRVGFDAEHFESRAGLFEAVFPELSVLGIYTTGTEDVLSTCDQEMNVQFMHSKSNLDSGIILKLNTSTAIDGRNLPLFVYEADRGVSAVDLCCSEWQLISEDSERIGVNHIAKLSTKDGSEGASATSKQYQSNVSATGMLIKRVEVILAYLNKVKNDEIPMDLALHRESVQLSHRLRIMVRHAEEYDKAFDAEEREITAYELLPKLTALMGSVIQVWSKLAQTRSESNISSAAVLTIGGLTSGRTMPDVATKSRIMARYVLQEVKADEEKDDEGEDMEQGPRRKIHAADSAGGAHKSNAITSSRSSTSTSTGVTTTTSAAAGASFAAYDTVYEDLGVQHGEEPVDRAYIPDAPMPSASADQ